MKSFNLTKKKKVWLFALALLALILLAIVINIQLNQPEHMSADYVGLSDFRVNLVTISLICFSSLLLYGIIVFNISKEDSFVFSF